MMLRKIYNKSQVYSSFYLGKSIITQRSFAGKSMDDKGTVGQSSRKDTYGGLHLDISTLPSSSKVVHFIEQELTKFSDLRTVWIKLQDKHYGKLDELSKVVFLLIFIFTHFPFFFPFLTTFLSFYFKSLALKFIMQKTKQLFCSNHYKRQTAFQSMHSHRSVLEAWL